MVSAATTTASPVDGGLGLGPGDPADVVKRLLVRVTVLVDVGGDYLEANAERFQ